MSDDYRYVEQDPSGPANGGELPTYDDLIAQNGPNSRFGRWRGWIEKRAAERYMDITPEERMRRRERGWGNEEMDHYVEDRATPANVPIIVNEPPTPTPNALFVQTSNLDSTSSVRTPPRTPSPPLPPLPAVSQKLHPTHLRLHQFGSRFLPHTTTPIRCLLPLVGDRLLLIGHDDGLSVLDMYPREWNGSGGITVKGPEEAQARAIWQGESVYQMSIIESEDIGEGTPQGVVLALVGPEAESPSGKDTEALRVLRMYNLASLTSLAKWAVAQKGARPLDLRRPSNWNAQSPVKKHRPQHSLARGLKSLIDNPLSHDHSSNSYQTLLSPSPSVDSARPSSRDRSPQRRPTDDSWDLVDDLPLRWATDFVPLASHGSRLGSCSVLSYALWNSDERNRKRGGRLLAVATKNNIFLYETPKGERAFRFVKEFYTPMVARSITFFQQTVTEISRSLSADSGSRHRRSDSTATLREANRISNASTMTVNYGTQLSLFVIFDKKAGWIRLADSAVGEMELQDDTSTGHSRESSLSSPSSRRKSRISSDSFLIGNGNSNKWIPPSSCELPVPLPPPPSAPAGTPSQTLKVTLLTKGKKTHIVPCPVPSNPSAYSPYRIVTWRNTPTNVIPRLYEGTAPDLDGISTPAYLQLISLGELGVEIQELPLTFLSQQPGMNGKGKGKARAPSDEILYAEEDTGGDAGFLCKGGHWDMPQSRYGLSRAQSSYSFISDSSGTSVGTEELLEKIEMEQGIYCWCRKGLEDYRVFWLGGSLTADYEEDEQ
ncbi:hypothetical protein K435DRAFT_758637 [Dendrothele bispora CBS 962.96]|uniref:Uncharacterized protein n=1 Tax=Dendrothele bispora (strain CBS 962.96) TaxID=1314807 RepID=A0A4S8LSI9_DENBC|nr:hypothetical protein K435DRAFT_758637 [Dendrothele bispora CBS 962.96]